jgi:hypothetical protein
VSAPGSGAGAADRARASAVADRALAASLAPFERACIAILRCYCAAWSKPSAQGWERALDLAAEAFGEREGGRAARRVLDLMRALRASRRSTFHFNNPFCAGCSARLTDGERLLAAAVRAARDGDACAARTSAIVLCEGGPTESLLHAAHALADLARTLPPDVPGLPPPQADAAGACCGG